MKKKKILFAISMFTLLITFNSFAQIDLQEEVITTPNQQELVLTREELKAQREDFVNFITKYKSDVFVGFAQYAFSTLNLSLKAHVKYTRELDGTISFQMATAGNHHISHSDVTFPMQAKVYFELKQADGQFLGFTDATTGEAITLKGKAKTLYLVETEEGFKNRKDVQIKHMKAGKAIGRFFAKVEYDLFGQDVEFYEIDSSAPNENVLLRRGHFKGNVSPSRTGF